MAAHEHGFVNEAEGLGAASAPTDKEMADYARDMESIEATVQAIMHLVERVDRLEKEVAMLRALEQTRPTGGTHEG